MVKAVYLCNHRLMLTFILGALLFAVSPAQTPEALDASQEPLSNTLEQRCPSGFADPGIYKHLSREPVMSYPTQALRKGHEGRVGMRLIVGCDGVVKECAILSSSGHKSLDERACQIMARVAFDPPRDESGQPREGAYTTSLTFEL